MRRLKLSTWVGILTILQFVFVCVISVVKLNGFGVVPDLNHEDLVFTMYFMTYFIIKSIEGK